MDPQISTFSPTVQNILTTERKNLLGEVNGTLPGIFSKLVLEKCAPSLSRDFAVAECQLLTAENSVEISATTGQVLFQKILSLSEKNWRNLDEISSTLAEMSRYPVWNEISEKIRSECHTRYPRAECFMKTEEKVEHAKKVTDEVGVPSNPSSKNSEKEETPQI